MSTLVCGGAGYIGSHMVRHLIDNNIDVVVIDSLVNGHKESLPQNIKFYNGDIRDKNILDKVFTENNIDSVIDFAAFIEVGQSMKDPLSFFDNNVYGTITLLQAMVKYNVKYIVFSSTAATYGIPKTIPITEDSDTCPINPYGETKLMMEKMLKWCDTVYGIKYTALRYFNASGAHPDGTIGEAHNPETHLIPLILSVAQGKRDKIYLFGDDYNTPDGTCVRDYIHVCDLASAHLLALNRLKNGGKSTAYNLGNGTCFSNKQVLEIARKVTNHPIPCEIADRRPGDPDTLIASSERAMNELNWKPQYNDLETIISTAWHWHQNHLNGYN